MMLNVSLWCIHVLEGSSSIQQLIEETLDNESLLTQVNEPQAEVRDFVQLKWSVEHKSGNMSRNQLSWDVPGKWQSIWWKYQQVEAERKTSALWGATFLIMSSRSLRRGEYPIKCNDKGGKWLLRFSEKQWIQVSQEAPLTLPWKSASIAHYSTDNTSAPSKMLPIFPWTLLLVRSAESCARVMVFHRSRRLSAFVFRESIPQ